MKHPQMTLAQYVKKRNGVALGAAGSLSNMLHNSLGAASFAQFWLYWNPIWGYYLARFIMQPCRQVMPGALAIIATFTVSGALHDLAISLLKAQFVWPLTPWFSLMGLGVVATKVFNITYGNQPWLLRAFFNASWVLGCYAIVKLL
ncbi:hypothetical protein [Shewanella waksmanii]|uniref:hypothetical protein n=1 Tax=Shewanella waksmanii TaxID=213783 RepID=UPI000491656D|nr:hypothetical protein [Shewanella waksmanii]